MRGEKVIDLGFSIDVSQGGEYVPADTVTVRAPGFRGKGFEIHTTMQAYVSSAALSFAKQRELFAGQRDAAEEPGEGGDEQDVMQIMSMGLGVDAYPKFAAYVQRVLTNSELATVGESGRLTDEAWEKIEEAGGAESCLRIMSEFTGFFFGALGSSGKTGSGKSPTSSSRTKVASASRKSKGAPG